MISSSNRYYSVNHALSINENGLIGKVHSHLTKSTAEYITWTGQSLGSN